MLLLILVSFSLSAHDFSADRELLNAYLTDDMPVWKAYIDSLAAVGTQDAVLQSLPYEYGYCAAQLDRDKELALTYTKLYKAHVEAAKELLPKGHYAMYVSSVYVYEMALRISLRPAKTLTLAKKAVKQSPDDPMVLNYYGMTLFYAPKAFGSKKEALDLFLRAVNAFEAPEWHHCWWRASAMMYVAQCYLKLGQAETALQYAEKTLQEYPGFRFVEDTLMPEIYDSL